jgi:predicted PhzF superfamily epimerase YddE/YHI9
VKPPAGLAKALGAAPVWTGFNGTDYFVEVTGEKILRGLAPDFGLLARLRARGVVVTCAGGGEGVDFQSRFFAPAVGVNEDPATGSSHCALGPFWGARLGKAALTGYQASERGGLIRVEVRGDRVVLRGQAVRVSRVTLFH